MRRSICYSDPAIALAGQKCTWHFVYTTGTTLSKGAVLRFDMASKGRAIDWEIPSTQVKNNSNIIWAEFENGKAIAPKAVQRKDSVVPYFDFTLPHDLPAGKSITICMGTRGGDDETQGSTAQLIVQRRKPFHLHIDSDGSGDFSETETFTIDVKGNTLKTIKIISPSFVIKNKRFDVVLRFEDEFGNLTSNAPEDTLIELRHGNLRENLTWKLFVPETGFITLPNLYFNEVGVFKIELLNVSTGDVFESSPIRCLVGETKQLFWGTLHGESERYDSTEHIDSCLRHFRDEKSMNFYATSHFDSTKETTNEVWKAATVAVGELDEDDRFSVLLGQQWVGEPTTEGTRIFLFNKDERPIIRAEEQKSSSLKKIYKSFSPKELLSIITFSMGKGHSYDFEDFDKEHERVAEIYNAWGSSEKSIKDGNSRPILSKNKSGYNEAQEGALVAALMKNRRFGFVAGGLDDRGIYSGLYESDQVQYSPGLTAVLADSHTRTAILDALYARNCYATTGERMIVGVSIAGKIMGSEISTLDKPGLHMNRHIEGFVAGTTPLLRIEIIRNGKVLTSFEPGSMNYDFAFDDMDSLSAVSLKGGNGEPPFTFYYLRALQEDGHIAWSSPIWIDCHPYVKGAAAKKSPNKKESST